MTSKIFTVIYRKFPNTTTHTDSRVGRAKDEHGAKGEDGTRVALV